MRFVSGSLDLKLFLSRWRPRGPEFVFPRVHPPLALGFFSPRGPPLHALGFFFSALGPGFFFVFSDAPDRSPFALPLFFVC